MTWIPAITTSTLLLGLLSLVVWVGRSFITTWMTKAIGHRFDVRIEEVRTDLRQTEEAFKADLESTEAQLASLRSGALAALQNRQTELDKRRIIAVDQLWTAVTAISRAKTVSGFMATVNFDVASAKAEHDPRVRQMFEMMSLFDPKTALPDEASKARPFVSQMAWALYSAYQSILTLAVARLHLLKAGLNEPKLFDETGVKKLIIAALPHQEEYIKKFGVGASHYLLNEIELRLLEELQRMMRGKESDRESVEQASEILRAAEEVMKSATAADRATATAERQVEGTRQ